MRAFGFVCCLILLGATTALGAPRLGNVSVADQGEETLVHLAIDDGAARPNVHMLGEDRLVIDLPGIEPALTSHQFEAGTARLTRVRIGLHHEPALRTRVVFDLNGPTSYAVRFVDGGLDVSLRPPGAAPVVDAPPAPAAPEAEPEGMPPAFEPLPSPRPTAEPLSPPTKTPIATPTPSPSPLPSPSHSPAPSPSASASPSPSPLPTHSPAPTPSPAPTAAAAAESRPTAVPADERGKPDADHAEPIPSGTVTIDFRDADVRTVIDLIANVGGYDVIFTPEVSGQITIRIIDGPWDEALDTVLEKNRLRATRHADLILVSPDDWE